MFIRFLFLHLEKTDGDQWLSNSKNDKRKVLYKYHNSSYFQSVLELDSP